MMLDLDSQSQLVGDIKAVLAEVFGMLERLLIMKLKANRYPRT